MQTPEIIECLYEMIDLERNQVIFDAWDEDEVIESSYRASALENAVDELKTHWLDDPMAVLWNLALYYEGLSHMQIFNEGAINMYRCFSDELECFLAMFEHPEE